MVKIIYRDYLTRFDRVPVRVTLENPRIAAFWTGHYHTAENRAKYERPILFTYWRDSNREITPRIVRRTKEGKMTMDTARQIREDLYGDPNPDLVSYLARCLDLASAMDAKFNAMTAELDKAKEVASWNRPIETPDAPSGLPDHDGAAEMSSVKQVKSGKMCEFLYWLDNGAVAHSVALFEVATAIRAEKKGFCVLTKYPDTTMTARITDAGRAAIGRGTSVRIDR